jgi:ubiquitin-protein ligase E3 C
MGQTLTAAGRSSGKVRLTPSFVTSCTNTDIRSRRPLELSAQAFAFLVHIVKRSPSSISPVRERYYRLIAKLCSVTAPAPDEQRLLLDAVIASLAKSEEQGTDSYRPPPSGTIWSVEGDTLTRQIAILSQSYEAFAFCFLTSANLGLLEKNPQAFAKELDLSCLSQGIIEAFSRPESTYSTSRDDLLWLLAHFIALNRSAANSQGLIYLQALYRQLSVLAADIRLRSAPREDEDDDESDEQDASIRATPIPDYVTKQLEYLVNEDGIAELLSRFTS